MKSPKPKAELRLRSLDGDGWAWSYVEPETGVELFGNETYADADEAREWARRAYPDVPFGEDERSGQSEKSGED